MVLAATAFAPSGVLSLISISFCAISVNACSQETGSNLMLGFGPILFMGLVIRYLLYRSCTIPILPFAHTPPCSPSTPPPACIGFPGSPYTFKALPSFTCTLCQHADGQKEQPLLTTLSTDTPSSGLQISFSVKGNCSNVVASFHVCMAKLFSTNPNLFAIRIAPLPTAAAFKKLLLFKLNLNSSSVFIVSLTSFSFSINVGHLS